MSATYRVSFLVGPNLRIMGRTLEKKLFGLFPRFERWEPHFDEQCPMPKELEATLHTASDGAHVGVFHLEVEATLSEPWARPKHYCHRQAKIHRVTSMEHADVRTEPKWHRLIR